MRIPIELFPEKICNKNNRNQKNLQNSFSWNDNRNFLQSLLSKRYGIDYVGAACLSHREEKSNINARYTSMEYEDKLELYETYWAILRENKFAQLTKNAIEEQVSQLSKESIASE